MYSLAWSADGRTLLSGSKDGAVNVWDAIHQLNEEAYATLPTSVVKFEFLPDSHRLVTLSRDLRLTLWDLGTGEPLETIATLGVDDGEMAISPDGTLLAVGDKTGMVHVWDLVNRSEVAHFGARAGQPLYVKFLPGGQELLTVDGANVAQRWRTGSWTEAASWQLGPSANAVSLAPDGRWVASGHLDGTVRAWNVATGRELAAVAGHRRRVTGVAFTPDGGTLVTASEDALVKLWNPATLREMATLRGHLLGVHSVQVSPDGRRLASGSHAKEAVKLWDLATRQEVTTLEGRGSFFYRTMFSPDGRILAAVNLSGELHLWRTPSLADIEASETRDKPAP